MQVSIEKISNVERRLTIVVPANQVEEAYVKHINEFAKKASIKGFRPGKVPMSVIQKRFGEDARKEALSDVIQASLYKAISDEKLKPVSTPRVEPKLPKDPADSFEFVASFEVLPEIEGVKFSLEKLEKPVVAIEEVDIERVIQHLQKQYTNWHKVDRPAQEKDRVVIDYYAIFEGKSEEEQKNLNTPVELGSNVMLPGFEEGLVGATVGEQRKLALKIPDNEANADRAGKPVDFVVDIKQIFAAERPEFDEKFITKLGVKSGKIEDLKQQIKDSLEQERDRLVNEKLKEQIFGKLLEQNPLEVPKSLIERDAKGIHDEIYANQPHNHHQHTEQETAAFEDIAKKRLALGLLIEEYAKQAELKADKDRVNARIQQIASSYENPREVVQWLSADERRGNIEAQILEDQVLEKMMEGLDVTEKTMSYADLKGIRI